MIAKNVVIHFTRDAKYVHVQSAPDPSWRFTDASGHEHAYGPDFTLPTCEWHSVPSVYEDGEPADFGWWKCRLCGERIHPGRYTPPPRYVAGPVDVDGSFETTDAINPGDSFPLGSLDPQLPAGDGIASEVTLSEGVRFVRFVNAGAVSLV